MARAAALLAWLWFFGRAEPVVAGNGEISMWSYIDSQLTTISSSTRTCYSSRFEPNCADGRRGWSDTRHRRAEFDAWMLDGMQVGTLAAGDTAGSVSEDPSQIDFLGTWEDVRQGAYDGPIR